MIRTRRSGLAALLGAATLLTVAVGTASANPGTYTVTACYSVSDNNVYIHQVWSGTEIDVVTGIIGTKKVGFGFVNALDPAVTSLDETDGLLADPHASLISTSVGDLGATLATATIKKPHGSWAKLPAC